MKIGDIVRFKSSTPIFKRQGETLALITRVVPLDEGRTTYLCLLMPTGEVKARRIEDVEVVIEAG